MKYHPDFQIKFFLVHKQLSRELLSKYAIPLISFRSFCHYLEYVGISHTLLIRLRQETQMSTPVSSSKNPAGKKLSEFHQL